MLDRGTYFRDTDHYTVINLSTVLGAYNPERDDELWRAYKNREFDAKKAIELYTEALDEEGVSIP